MIKTFFNKFIALFLALNLLSGVTFAQLGPLGTIPTYNANNVNKNGNIFESTQDYLEQKRVEVLKKEIQDSLPTFQEALPEIQKAIREDFKLKKNAKVDSKVAKAYYEYLITSIAQDYQQAVKVANHLASFGDGNTTNPGTRQIGLNIPKQYAFIIGQLETVKNVKENDLSTATLNIKGLGVVSVKNFIQGSVRAILNKELGSLSKAKALGALGLFNQLVDKGGLLESDVARAVQYLKYAIDGSAEYCDRSQSYCANIGAAMTLLGVLTPKGQKYASQEVIYNTLVKAHREGYKYEAMLLEPAIAALISLKTGEAYKRIEEFVLVEIAPQGDGWKKFKKVTGELFELISINAWASRFIQNGEVDSTFGGKYLDYISQRYQIVDEAYAKYIGGITKEDFTNSSKAFKIPYRNILENIGFMIATTGTENGNQLAYKILEKYVQLDAARRKQMVPQTENKPIYIGGGPMSMGGVSALPDNARHIDPSAHMNVPLVAGILQSEKLPPNQDMRTAAQLFNTYDWWDINAVTQHRLNNIPNGNKNLKTQARIYGIPSRKKDYTSAGGGLVRLDKEDYTTTQRYLANERLLRKTMFVDMVIGAVFLTQLVVSAPRIVVSVAKAGQAISKLTPVYANNAARIVRLTFNGKGSLYRTLRANSVNINKYMFADARVAKYRAQKLATQKNKAIKNETKVKGNPKASITKIAVAENETLLAKTKFRQAQFDYVIERLIDPATKAKIKFQAAKISKWKIKRQSSSVGGESSILSEDAKVYLSLKNQAQVNVDFANISLKQAKKGYGLEGFTREGQPIFAPLPKVEFTKWIDPNIPSFATKATNIIKTQTANLFNNIQGFPAKTADIFKTNAVSFFAQTGKIRQSFASLLLKQITKPLPSAKVAGAVKQTTSFNQLMIPIEKSIEKLQGNITKIIENFVKGKAGKTVILSSFGFGELNNWLNRSQSIKDYKEYVQKAINTARTKIWEDLINNNFSTKHMGSSFVEYLSEAMKKDERIPLDLRKEILSNFRTMLVAEMRIHVNPRQVLSDINYEKSSRVDLDNPMLSNLEYFAESKDYNIRVRKLLSVFSKKNKEVKYVSENFENIIFKASSDALDLTKKRLGEVNEETRLFRETLVVSFGKTISSQLSKLGDDSIISLITGKTQAELDRYLNGQRFHALPKLNVNKVPVYTLNAIGFDELYRIVRINTPGWNSGYFSIGGFGVIQDIIIRSAIGKNAKIAMALYEEAVANILRNYAERGFLPYDIELDVIMTELKAVFAKDTKLPQNLKEKILQELENNFKPYEVDRSLSGQERKAVMDQYYRPILSKNIREQYSFKDLQLKYREMFPKKDGELNFNPVKDLSIEELENLEKSLPKGERSLAGFLYPNNHEAQAIMYKLLQLVEHMPLDATAYNKFIAQIASMLPLPEPYLIASNKIFADMQKLLLGRVDYTTPNIIDRWERAAKISREITPEFKDLKTPNPPFGTNLLFNKDNFYFSRRLSKRQLLKRYPNAANSKDGLKEFYKETRFYLQTFGNFFLLDVAPYAELLKVENEKDLNVGGYATLNNTIVLDLAREFKNRAPEEFTTIFAHEFTHILQHVFFERLDHTGLLAEVFNSHLLSFNENSGSSGMLNNMFLAAMEKLFGYILAPIEVNAREKSLWLVNGIYNPSNPLHPYLTSLGITLPYGNPDPQFNGLVQSYLNPFLSFNTIKHNTTNNLQKSVEGIAKKVSFNITGYTNPPIGYNQDRVNNFVHKLASALSADNVGFISSPALGGKDIGTSLKFVQKEYNNTKNKIPLLTIATKDEIQSIYTNGLKKFDITNYGRQKKVVFPNSQIKLEEAVKIGDITMIIGGRNNSLNTFFNAMSYLKNIIIVDDQTFGNGAINLATNSTDNAARYVAEQYQAIMKGRPLPYKPSSEFEKSVWETIEKFPEVFKEKILVINMEDANAVSKIKKFTKPILQAKGKAKGKIKDSDSSKGIDKIASKVRPVAASVLPKDTPEFVRNFPTNRITKKVVKTTNPNQLSLFGTGYGITFAPSSAPITSLETEFAAATETANIDPEVKKAVVKVLTGTSQGSGFYTKINNRPFIVTAGHVINNSRNNFIIDETITLANDNGIIGTAKLWDYTIKDGIDFALYTVDQNIMTGIKPLKLSKEALKQGENATALGYPKSNNALLTSKHVFINNPLFTDDGNLPFPACLLTGNCGLGFSGGPVLNKNGKVFGMLIKSGIGSDLSIAMPLGIIKNFLNNPLKSKIPITVKQTANSTINIENTYQKLEIINKLEKQALSELPENWDDSKRSLVAPNPGTQQSGIKFINAMLGGDNNPLGFSKGQIENLIGIKRFLNQGEYSNYEISIASIANIAKSGDIHYVFVGKSIENIAQYAKTLEANGDGVIFIRIKSNPFLYINESTLLPVLPTDGQKIAFTVKVHSSLVYGKLRPEFSRLEDPNEILEPKNFATNLQAFFDRTGTKEITVFMETCAAGAFIPEFMALPEDLRKGINIITTTNGNESRGVMEYNQYLIHGGSSTDARIEGLLSSGKIGAQYIKGGEVYNPLAEAVKQAKNLTEPYQGIPAETLQRDLQALDNLYNKVAINDNGHLTEILQTLPEYIFHIEQGDGRPYFPAFTADIKNLNHSRVSDSKARIKIPDYVANYVAEVFKNNMPHFAGTPKLPLAGFTNSSAPLSISSVPQTPTTLNPAAKPANIATVKPDIGSYGGGGVEIINNLEREALKKLPEDIVQKKEVFFNYVAPTTNPNSYSIEFIDNLLNQKDLNLQENIVNNLEAIKASLQNPEGVINISIASVANIARGGNISYVLMGQGIEEIAPYAKQLETSGDGVIFISGDNNIFKLFNIQDTWATLPKLKLPNNNLLISLKTHSYISTQKHGFYSFIVINESPYSQRIFLSDLLKYTQKLALTTDAKKITLFLSTCHAAQFMNNLLTFPPLVRKGLNIITTTAVSEDGKLKSYNLSFPKGSNPADERIKSVLRYGNIGLMYMIDGQRYFPLETAVKAAKKRKEPYQGIPGDILYKELLALHKLYTVQTGEDYWLTWALNALPKHMFKKAPGHTFRSFAANTAIKIDPTDKKITYNVKIPQYIADYIVEVFESDMPHFAGDVAK